MDTLLIIISMLLITIVLLQSGKAENAGRIIQGGNPILFTNRKERGGELIITRITYALGAAFFIICIILSF